MKVVLGFKIKRLKKMRECVNTLERPCSCCKNDAEIEIVFHKMLISGKKEKITIRLCREHKEQLKDSLKYF